MKTIVHVVGARPNYMKVAPIMQSLRETPGTRQLLVNTGQHYDDAMSAVFVRELGLPIPDRNLDVGSASHDTNQVVGTDPERIQQAIQRALDWTGERRIPDLWDGRTSGRIASLYQAFLGR